MRESKEPYISVVEAVLSITGLFYVPNVQVAGALTSRGPAESRFGYRDFRTQVASIRPEPHRRILGK